MGQQSSAPAADLHHMPRSIDNTKENNVEPFSFVEYHCNSSEQRPLTGAAAHAYTLLTNVLMLANEAQRSIYVAQSPCPFDTPSPLSSAVYSHRIDIQHLIFHAELKFHSSLDPGSSILSRNISKEGSIDLKQLSKNAEQYTLQQKARDVAMARKTKADKADGRYYSVFCESGWEARQDDYSVLETHLFSLLSYKHGNANNYDDNCNNTGHTIPARVSTHSTNDTAGIAIAVGEEGNQQGADTHTHTTSSIMANNTHNSNANTTSPFTASSASPLASPWFLRFLATGDPTVLSPPLSYILAHCSTHKLSFDEVIHDVHFIDNNDISYSEDDSLYNEKKHTQTSSQKIGEKHKSGSCQLSLLLNGVFHITIGGSRRHGNNCDDDDGSSGGKNGCVDTYNTHIARSLRPHLTLPYTTDALLFFLSLSLCNPTRTMKPRMLRSISATVTDTTQRLDATTQRNFVVENEPLSNIPSPQENTHSAHIRINPKRVALALESIWENNFPMEKIPDPAYSNTNIISTPTTPTAASASASASILTPSRAGPRQGEAFTVTVGGVSASTSALQAREERERRERRVREERQEKERINAALTVLSNATVARGNAPGSGVRTGMSTGMGMGKGMGLAKKSADSGNDDSDDSDLWYSSDSDEEEICNKNPEESSSRVGKSSKSSDISTDNLLFHAKNITNVGSGGTKSSGPSLGMSLGTNADAGMGVYADEEYDWSDDDYYEADGDDSDGMYDENMSPVYSEGDYDDNDEEEDEEDGEKEQGNRGKNTQYSGEDALGSGKNTSSGNFPVDGLIIPGMTAEVAQNMHRMRSRMRKLKISKIPDENSGEDVWHNYYKTCRGAALTGLRDLLQDMNKDREKTQKSKRNPEKQSKSSQIPSNSTMDRKRNHKKDFSIVSNELCDDSDNVDPVALLRKAAAMAKAATNTSHRQTSASTVTKHRQTLSRHNSSISTSSTSASEVPKADASLKAPVVSDIVAYDDYDDNLHTNIAENKKNTSPLDTGVSVLVEIESGDRDILVDAILLLSDTDKDSQKSDTDYEKNDSIDRNGGNIGSNTNMFTNTLDTRPMSEKRLSSIQLRLSHAVPPALTPKTLNTHISSQINYRDNIGMTGRVPLPVYIVASHTLRNTNQNDDEYVSHSRHINAGCGIRLSTNAGAGFKSTSVLDDSAAFIRTRTAIQAAVRKNINTPASTPSFLAPAPATAPTPVLGAVLPVPLYPVTSPPTPGSAALAASLYYSVPITHHTHGTHNIHTRPSIASSLSSSGSARAYAQAHAVLTQVLTRTCAPLYRDFVCLAQPHTSAYASLSSASPSSPASATFPFPSSSSSICFSSPSSLTSPPGPPPSSAVSTSISPANITHTQWYFPHGLALSRARTHMSVTSLRKQTLFFPIPGCTQTALTTACEQYLMKKVLLYTSVESTPKTRENVIQIMEKMLIQPHYTGLDVLIVVRKKQRGTVLIARRVPVLLSLDLEDV